MTECLFEQGTPGVLPPTPLARVCLDGEEPAAAHQDFEGKLEIAALNSARMKFIRTHLLYSRKWLPEQAFQVMLFDQLPKSVRNEDVHGQAGKPDDAFAFKQLCILDLVMIYTHEGATGQLL